MQITVEAHHSKAHHFLEVLRETATVLDDISETHVLIGKTKYEICETYPDEAICEDAFMTFNWMTNDRDGLAPKEVNDRARQFDSHASMSVGDLVVIHRGANISIWKCIAYGWKRLLSFQTEVAGIPEV